MKPKKVLVLGGGGMLGNAVYSVLSSTPRLKVIGTLSSQKRGFEEFRIDSRPLLAANLEKLLKKTSPTYVVNCIGFIRPSDKPEDLRQALLVNAVFPRLLSASCAKRGARLIHISTDCVFSGKRGKYTDKDMPDEDSVYGLSKFLGEINEPPHLTIRTSIIGLEKGTTRNLLSWFLSQQGPVNGFDGVKWNGITTLALAKIIREIILKDINFKKGLIQVAGESLSKYEMLRLFVDVFGRKTTIRKRSRPRSDRTIVASREALRFRRFTPSLRRQLVELRDFYGFRG